MAVKAFKLLSGEELAGEVTDEDSETFTLDKARQLGLVQIPVPGMPEPQVVPQFVPWLLGNPEGKDLPLRKSAVTSGPYELPAPLEKLYLEQTSGLDLSTRIKT
jgi:hypothetical protein